MYKITKNHELGTTTISKKGIGPIGYYYKKTWIEKGLPVTRYYGVVYTTRDKDGFYKLDLYDTGAIRIRKNMINQYEKRSI